MRSHAIYGALVSAAQNPMARLTSTMVTLGNTLRASWQIWLSPVTPPSRSGHLGRRRSTVDHRLAHRISIDAQCVMLLEKVKSRVVVNDDGITVSRGGLDVRTPAHCDADAQVTIEPSVPDENSGTSRRPRLSPSAAEQEIQAQGASAVR